MNMRDLVKDLEARRAEVRKMGGEERVARQHARGKMTARERLAAFFDDGVYFEVGMHGTQMGLASGGALASREDARGRGRVRCPTMPRIMRSASASSFAT